MMNRLTFLLFAIVVFLAAAVPSASAKTGKNDRVQFGSSINVSEGEQVGDVVCIGCSIRMAGTAYGDTVAVGGSVLVEGTVKGDVVSVGGGVRLSDIARVNGDVVTIGGGLSRDPSAEVKGDIVSQGGGYVFPLLILIPLIPVILIVVLIWWLITRSNRPTVPAQQTYQGDNGALQTKQP